MATQGGRINFKVGLQQDQSSFNQLKKSLQDLKNIKIGDFRGTVKELEEVQATANKVDTALEKAFNVNLNSVNTKTFTQQLKRADITIDQIYSDFSKAGAQGQVAFSKMARQVLTTNLKLKQTHSILDDMGQTMMNTVKWGIASSVMNTFTGSVQNAFNYVKSLQASLTDIRIVTGDSQEKMDQFADSANKAAQALGRSTMDYTKSALTFYQQGLSDDEVAARTEATLKAQNITGAGEQMANYLTSVWNGYKVANEQAELYVDKLAAVADSSASDMSELAIAMSKVSATANNMGVDVDSLNAQLATVIATTRQAPESVGTAFKTIYSRINDIKTGADDAQISLGKYSSVMASLGFNVLDTNGRLKDTEDVITQVGESWKNLSKEQQVYLAQTMGGQRQITQLIALFDNWDTYTKLLNTSLESQGTLNEKNGRYMESLGAKMEQLGAAGEKVKNALIDEDDLAGMISGLGKAVDLFGTLIQSIGGGKGALLNFSSIATQLFSNTISKQITAFVVNAQNAKYNLQQIAEAEQKLSKEQNPFKREGIQEYVNNLKDLQRVWSVLSNQQKKQAQQRIDRLQGLREQEAVLKENTEQAQKFYKALSGTDLANKQEGSLAVQKQLDGYKNKINQLEIAYDHFLDTKMTIKTEQQQQVFKDLEITVKDLVNAMGNYATQEDKALIDKIIKLGQESEITQTQVEELSKEIDNFIAKSGKNISLVNNFSKDKKALKEVGKGIRENKKEQEDFNRQAEQGFQVKSIVRFVGGLGQIASAFNNIINLVKVWNNENLSKGQKVLQTFTNLTMTLPMLVTGFGSIVTISKSAAVAQQIATGATIGHTFAQKGLNIALNQGAAAALKLTGALLTDPIFLAVAAVAALTVAVGVGLVNAYNEAADAAQKAAKVTENSKKAYDEIKQSYQNLQSSFKEYHDAQDALSDLTKGTDQWNEALQNSNDKVIELLEKFPELAAYVSSTSDGLLTISEQGQKALRQKQQEAVTSSGMAYVASRQQSDQAQKRSDITDLSREMGLSGVINLDTSVLTNIIDVVEKNGTYLLGDIDKLGELANLTEDQKKAVTEHASEIRKLITETQANTLATKNLASSIVTNAIRDSAEYQNSSNPEMLAELVTKKLENSELNPKYYTRGSQSGASVINGTSPAGGSALDRDALAKAYNQIGAGQIRSAMGGFEKKNGQTWEKITDEQVKNAVAAAQNTERLAEYTQQMSQKIEQVQAHFGESANAVSKFLGDLNSISASDISQNDIIAMQTHIDEIAQITGHTGPEIQEKLDQLKQALSQGKRQLLEDPALKDSVHDVLQGIFNNRDLDLQTAESIKNSLVNAYERGGQQGLKSLKNFYNQIDDLDAFDKVAKGFDFTTGSAVEFKQALDEAGVQTNLTVQAIEDYIQAKKEEGDVTSPSWARSKMNQLESEREEVSSQISAKEEQLKTATTKERFEIQKEIVELQGKQKQLSQEIESTHQGLLKSLKAQSQASQQAVVSFGQLAEKTSQGKDLNKDQTQKWVGILDQLIAKYPEAEQAANILKDTQLAGTDEYKQAIQEVNQALQNVAYDDLSTELEQTFKDLKDGLADLQVGIVRDDFDQWTDDVETFLGAEHRLQVSVDTDAENSFETIKNELDEIYDAAGKIGQNFVIAADDVRLLEEVFPGITQGMQLLDDGSYQLNKNIVERALGTAQTEVEADKQAVLDRINNQQIVLKKKQSLYREMAKAALSLAQNELKTDEEKAKAQELISKGLQQQKIYDAELAANSMKNSTGVVVDASNKDGKVIAENFASAAKSAARSINNAQKSIIGDFNNIAVGVNNATQGQQTGTRELGSPGTESTYSGSNTQNFFTGAAEAAKKAIQTARSIAGNPFRTNKSYTSDFTQSWQRQYQMYNQGAQDALKEYESLEGLKTALNAKSASTYQSLNNVAAGRGIKNKTPTTKKSKKSTKKKKKSTKKKKKKKTTTKKVQDSDQMDYISQEVDIYHDIDNALQLISSDLKKVSKEQEKLTGQNLIDNLNKQLDILNNQVQAYKTKQSLAKQEAQSLRQALSRRGVTFDSNGQIVNYAQAIGSQMEQVNKTIAYYNSLNAERQKSYKDVVEKRKKDFEDFKDNLDKYDKLVTNTLPGLEESIQSALNEQIEKQIQKFKIAIDIDINISQAIRKWNSFKRNVIDSFRDDEVVDAAISKLQDFYSYYQKNARTGLDLIPNLSRQVNETINQIKDINSTGNSNIYGNNKSQALEDLKKYADELMSSLEDVQDLIKDVKKAFFDMVNVSQKAFDEQSKEYDFLSDLINHDQKLIQLLYGDQAFDKINNYYQKQQNVDKQELEFQRQQKDFWWAQMQAQKARMDTLDKESDQYKQAEERFKELEDHWLSAVNDFNSKVENSINNLLQKYKNNVSIIFNDLGNKLTNGKGLDYIGEEWQLISDQADDYLDKIDSMYEIQKLRDEYSQAIADNDGNIKAQQSLKNLMEQQLKMLQDKDRLTKYDVDRAKLLLEIENKRFALQQAQQSKSKLRLRRDAQGNYSYQYTSDQESISQAQQSLAEAQNSLYNLDKEKYRDNLNDIYGIQTKFNDKMQELYNQYPIWTEEAELKRQLLIEKYQKSINGLTAQNQEIRQNLEESAFQALADMYDTDVYHFLEMSNTEKQELMQNLIPEWNSGIQQMTDKFAGQGGFIPTCQQAFDDLGENTRNYEQELDELQRIAQVDFKQVADGIDININRTQSLIEKNDELMNKYDEEMKKINGVIDDVNKLIQTYRTAKQQAIQAANAAYNYWQQEQKASAAAAAAQRNSSSSSSSSSGSSSSSSSSSSSKKYVGNAIVNNVIKSTRKKKTDTKTTATKKGGGNNKVEVGDRVKYVSGAHYNDSSGGKPAYKTHIGEYVYITKIASGKYPIHISTGKKLHSGDLGWIKKSQISGYDTGGYTGEWGKDGKLGILHQKELILNASDTKNILSAVNIVRKMDELLNSISSTVAPSGLLSNMSNLINRDNTTNQNVVINASFPNASNRAEIESAFNNLINRAYQYGGR